MANIFESEAFKKTKESAIELTKNPSVAPTIEKLQTILEKQLREHGLIPTRDTLKTMLFTIQYLQVTEVNKKSDLKPNMHSMIVFAVIISLLAKKEAKIEEALKQK